MINIIKQTFLDHSGGFYHYKIHKKKVDLLCKDFPELKAFMYEMFENCPDDYFHSGPRSSALKFNLMNINVAKTKGHEVCTLTHHGLIENHERFSQNHPRVQTFMLEGDDKTIAMEIPIWLQPKELFRYYDIFQSNETLTGHIDVLRIEDGKIWVWDYKPNARKEKYASTQVAFYALMLSKRTGISLEHFRCGYFDENDAYMFKPSETIDADKQLISLHDFM